ncbi:MAG: hypothetical protein AAFR54_09710 [Planctomycetota bacterium]
MQADADPDARATGARLRRARFVVLVLVSLVAAAETGLRAAGVTPRIASVGHERYGYVLLPEQVERSEFGLRRVNAQGFFGEDWPAPDRVAADTFVVAVLDSSHGTGVGVGPDDAWPARLKEELASADALVLNASVGGWGIEQHAAHFADRLAAYEPDAVVIGVAPISGVPTAVRGAPGSWLRPLLARSVLVDLWQQHVNRDRDADAIPPRTAEEARRRADRAAYLRAPLADDARRHWGAAAEHVRAISRSQAGWGGRTLLLAAPDSGPTEFRPQELLGAVGDAEWVAPGSAPPFDVRGEALERGFLESDPRHWTAAGHRAVASAVARAITGHH